MDLRESARASKGTASVPGASVEKGSIGFAPAGKGAELKLEIKVAPPMISCVVKVAVPSERLCIEVKRTGKQ